MRGTPGEGGARRGDAYLKAWPMLAVAIVQLFLLTAHWFMYRTWIDFWWPMSVPAAHALRLALIVLSFVFMSATLLGFRFANRAVTLYYRFAALWMGLANFLFVGAITAWIVDGLLHLVMTQEARLAVRPYIAGVLLAASIVTCIYGLLNARMIRIRKVSVQLPNLPQTWRGRTAAVVSDLHLGHVNGFSFAQRIAAIVRGLNPAIVFFPGDMFDGSKVDPMHVTTPLKELQPPLGMYFVGGNHEEFGGAAAFEEALRAGGIRVLHNECQEVDGVRVVGLAYGPSTYPLQMGAFLQGLGLKGGPASILLNHVPSRLPLAEQAGVSLQLSGHTHGGGQMFPFNFITRRAFGKFTYGLQRFGEMFVYTSSGAGTWGPPMRVGTHSEVVLLTFV